MWETKTFDGGDPKSRPETIAYSSSMGQDVDENIHDKTSLTMQNEWTLSAYLLYKVSEPAKGEMFGVVHNNGSANLHKNTTTSGELFPSKRNATTGTRRQYHTAD